MATYVTAGSSARHIAAHRPSAEDPVTYTTPGTKRFDAKYSFIPLCNEVAAQVERNYISDVVRVVNTTGGTLTKGDLVYIPDSALSAQTSGTASNSPTAGTTVVLNVSVTFVVGQIVTIASGGITEYAIVTAVVASTSVTVDVLNYDHTTPTVTALPAYEIALADASNPTKWAQFVLSADVDDGEYTWAFANAEITGMDTSSFTVEKKLYLTSTATTTNTLTTTAPSASAVNTADQVVGVVKKSHASTGIIHFFPGKRVIEQVGENFISSDGTIAVAGPRPTWYKFTVAYTDIQTAATTNSYTFATLPIKGKVHATFSKHSVAFAGTSITAVGMELGITGTPAKYAPSFDVLQVVGNTVFDENDIGSGGSLESWTGTTSLVAKFTSVGADLSALTAGSVDIYVLVSVLP